MPSWLSLLLCSLAALLVLDSTVGRALLRLRPSFRVTRHIGGNPKSKSPVVYLPGILFDGDESVSEIKQSLLKPFATGLFISYGFWRFLWKRIVRRTAQEIGKFDESSQSSVTIVGASVGGKVAAETCALLQTEYEWPGERITVVMTDTSCENNSIRQPGLAMALILRRLYVGPIVSMAAHPIVKRLLVPPYPDEIEAGLDYETTKRKLVNRMARFRLSATCDQQRYLADNSIEWMVGLKGVHVIYMMCTHRNITVAQPAAMRKVELYTKGSLASFDVIEVPSPHCGFGQLPSTWEAAFARSRSRRYN